MYFIAVWVAWYKLIFALNILKNTNLDHSISYIKCPFFRVWHNLTMGLVAEVGEVCVQLNSESNLIMFYQRKPKKMRNTTPRPNSVTGQGVRTTVNHSSTTKPQLHLHLPWSTVIGSNTTVHQNLCNFWMFILKSCSFLILLSPVQTPPAPVLPLRPSLPLSHPL